VALHLILGARLLAVAFLQYLILQTAGQSDDTLLLCILSQIFLAFLAGSLAFLGTLSLHLLLLFLEIVLHNLLCFAVRHLQFVTLQHIAN